MFLLLGLRVGAGRHAVSRVSPVSSVPLLEALPATARDRAVTTAHQVAAASTRWLADYFVPVGRPQQPLLATHSLASTLACPNLSVAELTTLTCLRLWAAALTEHSD